MLKMRLIVCAAVLQMALAGCESMPPVCEWTDPPPLPASLMQEPQNLQPLLDGIIQPFSKGSKSSEHT